MHTLFKKGSKEGVKAADLLGGEGGNSEAVGNARFDDMIDNAQGVHWARFGCNKLLSFFLDHFFKVCQMVGEVEGKSDVDS